MNTAISLRPYQHEAIRAVLEARKNGTKRMVVCLPTGAGKTVIFSTLANLARRNVLVLAHREELLQQAKDKIERVLASGTVAIERAEQRAPDDAKIIVCSIRSLHEPRLLNVVKNRDVGLIIYDECHHAAAEDNLRVLKQLGAFNPDFTGTLLGFTATTMRGDGKSLSTVFEDIVYAKTLPEMVKDGYLSSLRGFRISTGTDLRNLQEERDDFEPDTLSETIDIEERNALVARSIQELARDRRTIAFCVNINHAKNLSRALNHLGVPAGVVTGAMKSELRQKTLTSFREGEIQVLTNVGVLTEGFDDPGVSCIAMARPTRSEGLYAQCIGRGTRLFPGKKDCLILDFVDLSSLDPCTLPSLFSLPSALNLEGQDVVEAGHFFQKLMFDYPGFELEAGETTLHEIQERAKHFDPLTQRLDLSIRAISKNAWASLGKRGLVLHVKPDTGKMAEIFVLLKGSRGKKWHVVWNDQPQGGFSTLEEAVEAVDYEVSEKGRAFAYAALPSASWRRERVPPSMAGTKARNLGEALQLWAFRSLFSGTAHITSLPRK